MEKEVELGGECAAQRRREGGEDEGPVSAMRELDR